MSRSGFLMRSFDSKLSKTLQNPSQFKIFGLLTFFLKKPKYLILAKGKKYTLGLFHPKNGNMPLKSIIHWI